MSFYCGIDLSARDSHVCVTNQQLSRLVDEKVPNDLARIIALLEPYKADMQIVVERLLSEAGAQPMIFWRLLRSLQSEAT